jgi:hypothetical protein
LVCGASVPGRTLGTVAPAWRWLLVALTAVIVSCLTPGSLLQQVPVVPRTAAIETVAADASHTQCAAVACNRGSSSSAVPFSPMSLAGMQATPASAPPAIQGRHQEPAGRIELPAGISNQLLRPPQTILSA